MLAAVYHTNSDVRIREFPRPEPGEGEILIRIRASGICGSDLMEWYRVPKAPLVLGHEIAGEVAEVGPGVSRFRVGDRVVATHHVPCEGCRYCLSGRHTNCPMIKKSGFDPGGFSEYVRVAPPNVERGVLHLPDNVSFEKGSFTEPLGCVTRAVNAAGVCSGESVAILGSGTAGLLCLQYVLHLEAGPVFMTDSDEFRLRKAVELGAASVFSPKDDIASLIKENNSGYLSDVVIVCTGARDAIKSAFSLVSPSGKILFFAPSDPEFTLDFPFNEYWWSGVRVVSSYAAAPGDLKDALSLIEKGAVDVGGMITHRFSLRDIQQGFALAGNPERSLKVMIIPEVRKPDTEGVRDSFFLDEEGVTDDFMTERASQQQWEREPFDS